LLSLKILQLRFSQLDWCHQHPLS